MDRIVANVNGEIILLSDVRKQMDLARRFASSQDGAGGIDISERKALTSMIEEKIIARYATENNVVVKEGEIDQAIDRVLESNKIKFDELEKALTAQGMTIEKYRERLREQMLIQKITGMEITGVNVSEEDARAYYRRNKKKFLEPPEEKIKVSHIVLLASEESDPAHFQQAERKIKELLKKIRSGADFAEVAKRESQDGAALNGGDLGWFKKGMMVKAFEDAAFSLKKGEVEGPVRTQYGFHIIKVTDRITPKAAPYDEVEEEVMAMLRRELFERKRDKWMERLRSQAYIEILY